MQSTLTKTHLTVSTGSVNHKMRFMQMINTSTSVNPFCRKMHKIAGTVCASCYAGRLEALRKTMQKAYGRNGKLLSSNLMRLSEIEKLPIYSKYVRFNAFGELINLIHLHNLVNIAMIHNQHTFALWTKRPELVKQLLSFGIPIPSNMILVFSTFNKNVLNPVLPSGFDKVFTVYNRKFARENNVKINCAGKSCIDCLNCYKKDNNITIINEHLR